MASLRVEYLEYPDVAFLITMSSKLDFFLSGILRVCACLLFISVVMQRLERVRDLFECLKHDLLIVRPVCLHFVGGCAPFSAQCPTVEERGNQSGTKPEDTCTLCLGRGKNS